MDRNTFVKTKSWSLISIGLTLAISFSLLALIPKPIKAAATTPEWADIQAGEVGGKWLEPLFLPFLQSSSVVTLYFPIVYKNPAPVLPLYSDNFANSNSGWPQGSDSSCSYSYSGGRYRIEIKKSSQECWSFGPSETAVRYGKFEVKAYGEGSGNFSYGIYINGKGGGEQYLFIVRPNDTSCSSGQGRYLFYRTKDNNRSEKLDGCHSAVKRGTGTGSENLLGITHTDDGKLSIYANGTLLGTYQDNSQLRETGTGLYTRSASDNTNTIRFDDFVINNP